MNPSSLTESLGHLDSLVGARLAERFDHAEPPRPLTAYGFDVTQFASLSGGDALSPSEHVLLLMTLVPHLLPDFYGHVIRHHLPDGGDLAEFGGVRGENHRGVLPTGETAQFVLGGDDLAQRLDVQRLLSNEHWLWRRHVLWLDDVPHGEPVMSGRLVLDPEIVER